LQKEEYFQPLI